MKQRAITITFEVLVDAEKIDGLEPIRLHEELIDPIVVLSEDIRISALEAIRETLDEGPWGSEDLGAYVWEAKVRIGQAVESTLEPF